MQHILILIKNLKGGVEIFLHNKIMNYINNTTDSLSTITKQLEEIKIDLLDLTEHFIDTKSALMCFFYLQENFNNSILPEEISLKLLNDDYSFSFEDELANELIASVLPVDFFVKTWKSFFDTKETVLTISSMTERDGFYKYILDKIHNKFIEKYYSKSLEKTFSVLNSFDNIPTKVYFIYFLLQDIQNKSYEFIETDAISDLVVSTISSTLKESLDATNVLSEELSLLKDFKKNYSEQLTELKKELQNLQKANKALTKQINTSYLQNKNQSTGESKLLKSLKKEMNDSLKKHENVTYNVLKNTYESLNETNMNTILDLKVELKELKATNKDLMTRNIEIENKSKVLEDKNKELLKNCELLVTKDLEPSINTVINIEDVKNRTSSVAEIATDSINNSFEKNLSQIENIQLDVNTQLENNVTYKKSIGYITISENNITVNYLNKPSATLKNIPENILLSNNQFVLTTSDAEFLFAYKQYYTDDVPFGEFCKITIDNGDIYGDNGETVSKLKPTQLTLKGEYIIGVVVDGEIKKLFKSVDFIYDSYIDYFKYQDLKAYYVIECLFNELLVYDIATGERKYIPMISEYVSRDYVIIMNGTNPVSTFKNSKFYFSSTYYKNYKVGYINFDNNKCIFTDSNTFETQNIDNSHYLTEGAVVKIDEFKRVISCLNSNSRFLSLAEQNTVNIRTSNKKARLTKQALPKIELDKTILIVGDIQLRQSYEKTFIPLGYDTKVISGFDGYNKVYQEANKADLIVITEGFVDHNIMWNLKKYYNNLFFVKNKGANYIANQIKTQSVSRKQMCLNS